MPIWKFQEEGGSGTETALEDVSLDLRASYQSLDDILMWLMAHDGEEFEDLASILEAAAYELEDAGFDFSTMFQSLDDLQTILSAYHQDLEDLNTSLSTYAQELLDIPLLCACIKEYLQDFGVYFDAASSTVFYNLGSYLQASVGLITDDMGVQFIVVKSIKAAANSTYQRTSSVIRQLT